jgi:uncharacterized protein (TIGR03083 family)
VVSREAKRHNFWMRIDEHIAALRREGHLMADAVSRADPDASVPSCPEWTVRELTHHLGRVHRWASTYVRDARTEMMASDEAELCWGAMPGDANLVDWYRQSHAELVDVLEAAPDDLACWSFLPAPSPLAFWARRQAHETTIHRVDAELATGATTAVGAEFAVDGIDELLMCFFSRRRNRLRTDGASTLAVAATDADAAWLVHIGPEGARAERGTGPSDAGLTGPAEVLYVGLWNRRPLDAAEVSGDAGLVELWRDRATVRWS